MMIFFLKKIKRSDCPPQDITPVQVEKRFSTMKNQFHQMKLDYEKSGNGAGQPADVNRQGKVVIDGSNLKNFLQGKKSHLLYYWKHLDETGLLDYAMSTIEEGCRFVGSAPHFCCCLTKKEAETLIK